MMEDQEWCKRAIEAGYCIVYEARSVVHHSHNHSIKMIFQRHFDYGASLRKFAPIPMTVGSVIVYTFFEVFGDLCFILSRKRINASTCKWILMSPVVRFAMRYGLYNGLRGTIEARPERNGRILPKQSEPGRQ
jgi:GT2 family glycosyltransferase